jgi:hypothetical protein
MSVGNTTNQSTSGLNTQLGSVAVALRDACQDAIQYFQGVNSLGVAGLEAIGFTAQDATDLFTAANLMQSVALVYYGLATQAAAFNYDNGLSEARGGH